MTTQSELGPFELERPLAVGPHAAQYGGARREHGRDDEPVEVRTLAEVKPSVRTRIARLRAIRHEGLLPILEARLDGPAPWFVVVAASSGRFGAAVQRDPRGTLVRLADALEAGHRAGVVHGSLDARHVLVGPSGPWLDLTGTTARTDEVLAPELRRGEPPTRAADVWALGTLLSAAIGGLDADVDATLAAMAQQDPEARPTAAEIGGRLDRTHAAEATAPKHAPSSAIPSVLGPYRLLEKLGEGGMGAVYRARAEPDDRDVALKVLLPEWSKDALVLARFRREARVLSQLASDHIARFIASHQDGPWEYMVMEFVEGRSAHWLLQRRGAFPVNAALAVACDVARALSEVHALGLVHRDVKPSNILISADSDPAVAPRAKLCDFGIVRPKQDDDGTALTRSGTPGTPSYMAPEQVLGESITPATDVYALGATLFALIANRPPFVGEPNLVMLAQLSEPPPALSSVVPAVPPDVAEIVARALAKDPDQRYPDARAMLEALEIVRVGLSANAGALPQPIALDGRGVTYAASWDLGSTPEELWPHVSNTERLNRAIGLSDVAWERVGVGDGQRLTGSFRAAGLELKWKENPFEWVAPHRLGVVREYESGPFEWMRSTVELAPHGDGTRLSHTVEIRPRGLLGRAAAGIEVGMRLRRALERTYRRIDDACQKARTEAAPIDPFEAAPKMAESTRELLHARLERAREAGGDAHVLAAIEDWIGAAPPQTLGRIRPYAFADRLRLDRRKALAAFLLASSEGVFGLLWDILCPTCRIPSQLETTLRALREHGRCDACDLDFEVDLARSVELVFRVEPTIRASDAGVYCIGGPAHSPHVVAQVRMPKGSRFGLDVRLDEGAYLLRGRGVPRSHPFRVVRDAALTGWPVSLQQGLEPHAPRIAREGDLRIDLTNDLDHDVVVRLERATDRRDVVTAADATTNATFRRLFPGEVLRPEALIGISHVALLCAELPGVARRYRNDGERVVHREVIELQAKVAELAEAEGGSLVKLQLEGTLAVFTDGAAATRAALRLVAEMGDKVRASVHAGTAMLTTINERLDYFGRTVLTASELLRDAEPGEVAVSEDSLRASSSVTALLTGRADLTGMVQRHGIAMRYRPRTA